jgi:hypothetical protein
VRAWFNVVLFVKYNTCVNICIKKKYSSGTMAVCLHKDKIFRSSAYSLNLVYYIHITMHPSEMMWLPILSRDWPHSTDVFMHE